MKRLLLGVFVFALIFSSCNKYADDFQALKDQISALAAQVKSVSDLQTTIASQTATIAALQTSINTLSTTVGGLGTKMTALSDSLTNVGKRVTYISNSIASIVATGTATKAMVTDVQTNLNAFIAAQNIVNADFKAKLIALQAKLDLAASKADVQAAQGEIVTLINSQVIALTKAQKASADSIVHLLTAKIAEGDAATQTALDNFKTWVNNLNNANIATLNQILSDLATAQTTADATNTVVDGLAAEMAIAQAKLDLLLQSNAMINEDVTIKTHADVLYWAGKIVQWAIINGNVSVNTKYIPATDMVALNKILNNIGAVIGLNPASVGTIEGWWWGDGDISLVPVPGAPHWVIISSALAADKVEANNLVSVIGDYTIEGFDVKDEALTSVGGTVTLNYPYGYTALKLASVGGDLRLVNQPTLNNTGIINLPNVAIGGLVGNHVGAPALSNTTSWNSTGTTSIVLGLATGGQINNLTANYATTIELKTIDYVAHGLAITAPVATDLFLKTAKTVAGGVVNINAPLATNVDLSALVTTSNNVTIVAKPLVADVNQVKLNAFNSNVNVTITGPQTLRFQAWQGTAANALLISSTVKTLTMDVYQWLSVTAGSTIPSGANLPVVADLTLGAVRQSVDISRFVTLVTANITGALDPTLAADHFATLTLNGGPGVTSGTAAPKNTLLKTLTLVGPMNIVNVNTTVALTAVNTSGVINTFTLNDADALLALQLDHTYFQGATGYGGTGSDLTITNNLLLASLKTTAVNKLNTLKIAGNAALASLDLSSYTLPVTTTGFTVSIEVYNNNLSGSFSPALAEFGTTPYKEALIYCTTLQGLRNYVAILNAVPGANYSTFRVDVDKTTLINDPLAALAPNPAYAVGAVSTLSNLMYNNNVTSSVIDAVTGISNNAEFQLLQN